ncbi:hypothetical protein [Gallibacterium anatis]|uniref:hypothetical protein n=1 Tax=Gallibacterium anatis TaxID=750 RepID=UPI00254A648D|nr:hypothetical protein [Gallibacterium anatis]WIM85332.1 hypothetical protein QP020_04790 [Gallibacterium anatis]WKS96373.1 hypothetical protein NYR19_07545 [Gallibacterium anatis]
MPILQSMTEAIQKKNETPSTSMATNVANNLDSNSLLMQSAAQKGQRYAAARGLQNSTIGAEAAQRAEEARVKFGKSFNSNPTSSGYAWANYYNSTVAK